MKKTMLAFLVLALMAGTAFAKSIEGKVVSTDAAANTLVVSSTDEAGNASESSLTVSGNTAYVGVASLGELKAEDQVTVQAEEDAATGSWNASSVELVTP